jgi:hypothetical protein
MTLPLRWDSIVGQPFAILLACHLKGEVKIAVAFEKTLRALAKLDSTGRERSRGHWSRMGTEVPSAIRMRLPSREKRSDGSLEPHDAAEQKTTMRHNTGVRHQRGFVANQDRIISRKIA